MRFIFFSFLGGEGEERHGGVGHCLKSAGDELSAPFSPAPVAGRL